MIVSVQGAELYCSIHGEGPPCLVLTSIGTKPYERQLPPPLTGCFQFVIVDLRGSGRSTGEATDLSFDQLAEDLEAVRAALGAERIAVLGHSILSLLAIEYGRRRPDTVSHVIVAGAPPRGDMAWVAAQSNEFFAADASEERKQILRDNLASMPPEKFLYAQTPMRFFDPRFDAVPLFAEAELRPALLQHIMGSLAPSWDITVGAEALRTPLFLAHGRYDYVVPYTLWEGIPEALPNAAFHLFERSGHQPFFEEPEEFVRAVGEWMDRVG